MSMNWKQRRYFSRYQPPCRSANEEHARLLAAGKPEGVFDSQAAEDGSLRAKVLQCIQGLQEGLLERGTEVSSSPQPPHSTTRRYHDR